MAALQGFMGFLLREAAEGVVVGLLEASVILYVGLHRVVKEESMAAAEVQRA
jgi:hypothetical protein